MSQKIFIVDGSGYIFRAFHAVAPLNAADGLPTNALFGFTRMLLKLIREADSEFIAVAFDTGRETFRREIYPEYKANREACPEELLPQMPYFRRIVSALGLAAIDAPNYEADDVIGTIVKRASDTNSEVVIVSADKDLMQLISGRVSMWDTMNDRHFASQDVQAKFGVPPEKLGDALALMGDSSDNIPGVDGVGPKTAAQLVNNYGDIEAILNAADRIREDKSLRGREKVSQTIKTSGDLLRLSRRLVEIATDAPLKFHMRSQNPDRSHSSEEETRPGSEQGLSSCGTSAEEVLDCSHIQGQELVASLRRREIHAGELRSLFDRLGFASLKTELEKYLAGRRQSGEVDTGKRLDCYGLVLQDGFSALLERLNSCARFAFDIETTGLDVLSAQVVGVSFCFGAEESHYLPLAHTRSSGAGGELDSIGNAEELLSRQVPPQKAWERLGPILANPKIGKIAQNAKYDLAVLSRSGVIVKGLCFDTMLAAYLLKPDAASFNLTALVDTYIGFENLPLKRVVEFDEVLSSASTFAEVPLEAATNYAAQDAHVTWLLYERLAPQLKEAELLSIFEELEVPLVEVLVAMELHGILLDLDLFAEMSSRLGSELQDLQAKIYDSAGEQFNINSPKQLAQILFERLKLPTKGLKKTKSGISTDASVLEKLAETHELPRRLLEYRSLHKLKSTYVDALPAQVSAVTGRLHTKFNQTGTATGRLSSSEPNLQNIPIQTPEGRRIRAGFVADSGKVLISADYSQIELRLLAHMSGDKVLCQAFNQDQDIHAQTARQILGIPESRSISTEQRRLGKTINFGIIYGMGPFRLARELGITFPEAERFIYSYFEHFPGVKSFFEALQQDAEKLGFVRTLFGRKRFLAEIDSSGRDKGFVARAALNAPIQGSAADVIKRAMIGIHREFERRRIDAALVLQIHDELLVEAESAVCAEACEVVKSQMESAVVLSVPLKVEVGSGKNWEEAHA